ncbi:MAG: excinuclease ABC subunit UvrC [Alphaproteobacteria bacterium]|nr:excinuclease ABC subunit UvrC [Alphaproteobacteria bacterium]
MAQDTETKGNIDPSESPTESLTQGIEVIKSYLKSLPNRPGVYRMMDSKGNALYVGKAKDLKKRVSSYTRPQRQVIRILRMIARTTSMEFITTHTEAEALLLESNLIKKLAPRYNILLRDDKSFPLIHLTSAHAFPRVVKHRGARAKEGEFFGPFASAWSVTHTLDILQQAFLLRTCSDSVFDSRTRPCLLYQIKRCCAPCVPDKIDQEDYLALVDQARAFLTGRSKEIQNELSTRMQEASDAMEFETAAVYRDRIQAMARVQAKQGINLVGVGDADVIAAHQEGGQTCIQVFFFRTSFNHGNRAYYPSHSKDAEVADVLEAFIGQFYANKPPPKQIFLSHNLSGLSVLKEALAVRAGHAVQIQVPQRGEKRKAIDHALVNAKEALARRMSESASQRKLLDGLAEALGLESTPQRIEVYDNSHIAGTNGVGAMIVAGPEGFIKPAYRKFNIKGVVEGKFKGGDDYSMAHEVLTRRFSRALKEDPGRTDGQWPDLVIFDGGKGQLSIAVQVFEELGIDDVPVAAIAKGPDRNAGKEKLFMPGKEPIQLEFKDPVLYFLQRLRDEAHRFAIGTHRVKRAKGVSKSILDQAPGVGAKRKRALLHHFGSAAAVANAGLEDLEAVGGISKAMAKKLYDHFHSGN